MRYSFASKRTRSAPFTMLISLSLSGGILTACGSSKGGSPTEPGSTSVLTAPAGLTISEVSVRDRTTTFTWNAAPGATGYVLEIGRAAAGTDFAVITLEGSGTSHRTVDMPVGTSFARVRAKNAATTSAASAELKFVVPDLRNVIEGLFFETGPNRYTDLNGASHPSPPDRLFRWASGSVIQVRAAGLNDEQYNHLERALLQLEEATHGTVRATIVERSSEPSGISPTSLLVRGELRIVITPDVERYCGNATLAGCGGFGVAGIGDNTTISSGSVVIKAGTAGADIVAHEIGHAVLALRHIQWGPWTNLNESSWPGLPRPLMFPTSTADRLC